jgi:uncharacterized protein YdhG (YjbR/CyaY superfamily)
MAKKTARTPSATAQPRTVDEYLAAAPKDKRDLLAKVRRAIRAAAPGATESISYGIAGYKYKGERLVYYGYWKDHCALYGFGTGFVDAHADELAAYDLRKGTLRFSADKPLPDRLVTRIVKSRIAEIDRAG